MKRFKIPWNRSATGRVAMFLFILVEVGCASESAESVLTAFMDAEVDGDVAALYSLLSDIDRATMTLEQWQAHRVVMMIGVDYTFLSYSITRIEQVGDTAEAVVEFEIPYFAPMISDLMGLMILSGGEGMTDSLNARIASGEFSTVIRTEPVVLLRERDGWRVYLNLVAEVADLESRAKAAQERRRLRRGTLQFAPSQTSERTWSRP